MAEALVNHAFSTVGTGGITSTATTLPMASVTGFPTTGTYRVVVDPGTSTEEIMAVTAGQGTTSWTVTRAAEATNNGVQTAFAHNAGAVVAQVLTVAGLGGWIATLPVATASALATGPLVGALNAIRDFNASGSGNTYTGSISLSTPNTLTLTAAGDFVAPFTNGFGSQSQAAYVPGAGASGAVLVSSVTAVSADGKTLTLGTAASTAVTNATISHDDTGSLSRTFAAGKAIYVPPGTYKISGTLSPQLGTWLECASGAVFEASHNTGDAVQLASGNWASRLRFGSIQNAGGAAIHAMPGCSVVDVWFDSLSGNHDGLLIEASSTGSTLQSNWGGIWLLNNTNAVRMKATTGTDNASGHLFYINYALGNTHGIIFDAPSGVNPVQLNLNRFFIAYIDGSGNASSVGITTTNGNTIVQNEFHCSGFFGAFASYYIDMNANGCVFWLWVDGQPSAAQMTFTGNNNRIINTATPATPALNSTPIAMATASGSQATFNGGTLLLANRCHLSLTIPAGGLAANSTKDFYAYHAFTTGYTGKVGAFPRWNVPLLILTMEDESQVAGTDGNISANQVHLRVYAVAAVAAGTYNVDLEIEG